MSRRGRIDKLPDFRTASIAAYTTGFVLSLTLTVGAFALVQATRAAGDMFSRGFLIGVLAVLAATQMIVQVLFFLHLSPERRRRFDGIALLFTIFAVLCIVVGSIWIMENLNYNMMPQHQTEYTEQHEGIMRQ
ncbi:MAG: cytochrome o ubiquinol oxidase subunit IV [Candidatus Saccharimonadales bacterium]|jgi:cytochrome o ubiquinol oxidase operon protein cyoD